MKTFSGEIEKLYDKLIEGKPFAFSKYADGEWMAMTGQPLNNGEFESNHQTIGAIENLIELMNREVSKNPDYDLIIVDKA